MLKHEHWVFVDEAEGRGDQEREDFSAPKSKLYGLT